MSEKDDAEKRKERADELRREIDELDESEAKPREGESVGEFVERRMREQEDGER